MPDLNLLSNAYKEMGCDYDAISARAKQAADIGAEPIDVRQEFSECVREGTQIAEQARQQMLEQQRFDDLVFYAACAAVLAVCVLMFLYRKPLRALLESLFVSTAAKAVTTKREMKDYRSEIARRIQEKSKP